MPRPRVPLTRSTLLETERSLAFAREGYDLLDRKREVLLAALGEATPAAQEARKRLETRFSAAYEELARARMAMGADRVRWAALSAPPGPNPRITERSVVGAVVPVIRCAPTDQRPRRSLDGTTADLDRAAAAFSALVETVCAAAQAEAEVVRLAREARKTQLRVNALRNVVIPNQEAIIKLVREALEDAEREAFFMTKLLKARQGGKQGQMG